MAQESPVSLAGLTCKAIGLVPLRQNIDDAVHAGRLTFQFLGAAVEFKQPNSHGFETVSRVEV